MVSTPTLTDNPIGDAAELLLYAAQRLHKPLVIAMHPSENDHGLPPGAVQGQETTELRPSCNGVVIALEGSAEEVQAVVDLILDWQDHRQASRKEP